MHIIVEVRGGNIVAAYAKKPVDVLVVDHDNESVSYTSVQPICKHAQKEIEDKLDDMYTKGSPLKVEKKHYKFVTDRLES